MAKRTVILEFGSGADDPAVKGSSIAIGSYYPHEDGTTWIHATPERYYVRGNTPPEVDLTVGEYYWFTPIDPKGVATLALIPSGVTDIYYSDLVENYAVDPTTLDPAAVPDAAWDVALDDLASTIGGKQDEATLAADTAAHVSDGSALDTAVSAKIVAVGDTRYVKPLQPSGDTTGVTDTAAIQANENAGRNTHLVVGQTYWVKGLVKKSNTHIYFNGATMQLPHGANDDVIVSENFASLTDTATNGGIHDFGIHGPGSIHGSRFWATTVVPTTLTASFNMSASFSLQLSSTTDFAPTGTATVSTQSGPQMFSWSANDTATGTLTCSSTKTGRILVGSKIFRQGYGVRVYGYNFHIGDNLLIHECLVDGLWTEWAPTIAVGSPSPEMESHIAGGKSYENGRNGHSFLGPHDGYVDDWVWFRNANKGFVTANSAVAYISNSHGWGAPQIISIEDHTGSQFVNCVGETTSASGSRGWVFYGHGAITKACRALWAGGGGNVGVEIQNSAGGCEIDMHYTGGFGNGALLVTSSGGGNHFHGVVHSNSANPLLSGTPHATDVIDLIPGIGTSGARVMQRAVGTVAAATPKIVVATDASGGVTVDTNLWSPNDAGLAGWSFDPAVCASQTAPSSGAIKYIRIKATDTRNVTGLLLGVSTLGSGLTAGQCLVALYDSTGARLALSADQSSVWTSTGIKTATVTATPVVAGQYYYIGFLAVGTTPPAFARGFSAVAAIANAGLTTAPFRFNAGATGQTALPSSFTPTALTAELAFWAAMS